ncbi:MAG TPA: cyclase family protein [Blastocatellia bacterium]|nr:cyclase family protein [Blastocatellia bacterium]HMV85802.1 cyclase family protein [Blastocatellia bacterium]HMX26953.1 cyclase family protein [Blastocatellia bacterium]HMY73162.1 cyclase family protein [Blastocatellia bacterium]HMZ19408.1 cyclase family protein [Blastocatellia bacterium]
MSRKSLLIIVAFIAGLSVNWLVFGQQSGLKKWQKGKGWGWVWGKDDEVGALNEMTDASRLAALRLATTGKTYDLGVTYDRTSYKWPGHSPGEIITFRSPEGVSRQKDLPALIADNGKQTRWHSSALFISDNVATQIDGLGHITTGSDNSWYNGFKEADWGGNFGIRKGDATTIPPIVARGVLIDVAASKNVEALPANYIITVDDLQQALRRQQTQLKPGDIVLIRTGTLRYWGETGSDHAAIAAHDSAGISLETARWLVEENAAMMLGSDTSGLEYGPADKDAKAYRDKYQSFNPVHHYLLIEQGIHIGEFHFLEDLARDRVYEFCYVAATNKIKGTAAGFTMRPIAIR